MLTFGDEWRRQLRISYITPAYGFDAQITHIGAPANAEKTLLEMGQNIAGSEQLIAIYIPEGTEE